MVYKVFLSLSRMFENVADSTKWDNLIIKIRNRNHKNKDRVPAGLSVGGIGCNWPSFKQSALFYSNPVSLLETFAYMPQI